MLAGSLLGRFEADWLVGLLLSAAVLWLGWENFRWLRRARWAGPIVLAEAGAPMRQFRWRGWALAVLGALGGRFGSLMILPIYPREGQAAIRVILQGIKGSRAPLTLLPGFILHGEGNAFTPAAQAILRDGAALSMAAVR